MPKDRKKKRIGRSRSHISFPPQQMIIPSSDNNNANCFDGFDFDDYDAITNVSINECGGCGKSNSKCIKEYIYEFIHILSTLCYFCSPPIVMLEIYGQKIAPILGFGLFLFKIFVLDLILYNMDGGRRKIIIIQDCWPKTFDLTAAVVFGLSAIFTFAFPGTDIQQFQSMFGIHRFSFGSLTLLIAITWFSLFTILIMIFVLIRIFNKLQQNMTKKSIYGINKLEMEVMILQNNNKDDDDEVVAVIHDDNDNDNDNIIIREDDDMGIMKTNNNTSNIDTPQHTVTDMYYSQHVLTSSCTHMNAHIEQY